MKNIIILVMVLQLGAVYVCAGELTFAPPRLIGDGGVSIAVADMNKDGKLDIVTCYATVWSITPSRENSFMFEWYENRGTTFTQHLIFPQNISIGVDNIITLDLDHDGDVDIINSRYGGGGLEWWENDGANPPNFIQHLIMNISIIQQMFMADLNHDGNTDLVLYVRNLQNDTGMIQWLENNGEKPPAFTVHVVDEVRVFTHAMSIGDVNGDGLVDILFGGYDWYQNDGLRHPGFQKHPFPSANSLYILPADLNGDGRNDFLGDNMWNENNAGATVSVTSHTLAVPGGMKFYPKQAADLDQDGHVDLLVTTSNPFQLYLMRNSGTTPPTFEPHLLATCAASIDSINTADIDGDGNLEIIYGVHYLSQVGQSNQLYLLKSTAPPRKVSLAAPNGGEYLHSGDPLAVAWRADDATTTVGLELWNNLDHPALTLADTQASQPGLNQATLTLPNVPTSRAYRLRAVSLLDPTAYDFSDSPFTILGPNAVLAGGCLRYR